jgi:hypothetical protein
LHQPKRLALFFGEMKKIEITEADAVAFFASKLQKLKGVNIDYISININADPETGEFKYYWCSAQAVDHVERKCGQSDTIDNAIIELSKALICDHDFKEEDHSFDHEFGTEKVIFDQCQKCEETKPSEQYEGPDNDI